MQNPPPVQTPKSSTGLDENIAALLSYVFGWVSGLIFFLIEKDSRLVKFHAMQSILFNVFIAVVGIVLWIITFVIVIIGSQLPGFLGAILSLLATLSVVSFAQEKVTYVDHVLPIFRNACNNCHNPDKKKAGLDLSN